MKKIWQKINLNSEKLSLIQIAIGILLLLFCFATYTGILYPYSTSQAILQGFDEDSSYGVETSIKTMWINHNSSVNYGPLYYRIATPIRHFVNSDLLANNFSSQEARFRNVHFHMLLLNLLAIFVTSFFLLKVLTDSWPWILMGTCILSGLFLANPFRSQFLFTIHPEHFAALLIMFATFQIAKWVENSTEESQLWQSSLAWALASLTKLVTILFCPAFLYLFWSVDSKNFRKNALYFAKWVLIFYLIIGFPQSWDVWSYLKKLYAQNSYSSLVSWEFLTQRWLPLFMNDYWRPLAFILAISFVVPIPRLTFKTSTLRKLFVFLLLSTFMIISKQTTTPFEYYTFSFVNVGLLVFTMILAKLHSSKINNFELLSKIKKSIWTPVVFFVFYPLFFNLFPKTVENTFNSGMICRAESETVIQLIGTKIKDGKKILTDPVFPYDRSIAKNQIDSLWEMSPELLINGKYQVIALKTNFYQIFLEPNTPKVTWLKDKALIDAIEFYKQFNAKSSFIDSHKIQWTKTYQDKCSFEIWERQ